MEIQMNLGDSGAASLGPQSPNDLEDKPGTVVEDQPQETPTEQPEAEKLLAGKYKSVEELEKGYAELQKKLGAGEPSESAEAPSMSGPEEATPSEPAEAVEKAGFNYDDLAQEFSSNGGLTDDTRAKLNEAGFDNSVIDAFIEGQQAIASQRTGALFELAGGEDQFRSMVDWGRNNLTDSQKEAFDSLKDEALSTGDFSKLDLMVTSIQARMGSEPSYLQGKTGDNSPSSGARPFENQSEMIAAINDPRYRTDPDYNAQVVARIQATQ